MYLYLVRHGQSVGNEKQLFFGHRDHPLTELGREQARQAADKLREVSFTRCVSSDLSRAWDTALICAEGRGVPVERDPALRELKLRSHSDLYMVCPVGSSIYGVSPDGLIHTLL